MNVPSRILSLAVNALFPLGNQYYIQLFYLLLRGGGKRESEHESQHVYAKANGRTLSVFVYFIS